MLFRLTRRTFFMEKKILNYINCLEGYIIRSKEIHWSTSNNSQHELMADIYDAIGDYEDKLTEAAMGNSGKRFRVGDLLPMLPDSTEVGSMLKELIKETKDFRKSLDDEDDSYLINILDDILTDCKQFLFRSTLS